MPNINGNIIGSMQEESQEGTHAPPTPQQHTSHTSGPNLHAVMIVSEAL